MRLLNREVNRIINQELKNGKKRKFMPGFNYFSISLLNLLTLFVYYL